MFAHRHPAAGAIALAALLVAVVVGGLGMHTTAGKPLADPRKCVEVTDAQGHPLDTVCVPWLVP